MSIIHRYMDQVFEGGIPLDPKHVAHIVGQPTLDFQMHELRLAKGELDSVGFLKRNLLDRTTRGIAQRITTLIPASLLVGEEEVRNMVQAVDAEVDVTGEDAKGEVVFLLMHALAQGFTKKLRQVMTPEDRDTLVREVKADLSAQDLASGDWPADEVEIAFVETKLAEHFGVAE